MKTKFILLVLCALSLQACTTRHYIHPNKDQEFFITDKADCINKHKYEVCNTAGPGTKKTICKDNVVGYVGKNKNQPVIDGTVCKTEEYPAQTYCYMTHDYDAVHNCLLAKGWREVDERGDRK